ncbi:MAG: carbamoyltransferase N-terminal domain-containing protein, partial [Candidatus Riflebacteria bacterium]|nr:carbamoyltransferase N-terminal domain-containing protein [Candidatus Riflebacteria bacterium]
MNILGINSAYHESAAALLIDGKLVCFVEEERINRIKHAKQSRVDNPHVLPEGAIRACLDYAGLKPHDIDYCAYSFAQNGRLQNIDVDTHLVQGGWGSPEGEKLFHERLQEVPARLARLLGHGIEGRFVWVDHHIAHAASAFYCSPFDDALVLVVDGIGEFDSITAYNGTQKTLEKIFALPYPHSLGFLWEKICSYLGFSEYDACKLMGLSSYGDPLVFAESFKKLAWIDENTLFKVDNNIARFRSPDCSALEKLFGPARKPGAEITATHKNIAATLQKFTEDVLLILCDRLKKQHKFKHLCLAGGTALNCVANAIMQKHAGFDEIFIQPAANDAGTALGAALHLWCDKFGNSRGFVMNHSLWGPDFDEEAIQKAVAATSFRAEKV